MSNWSIGYDVIDKTKSANVIQRNYRFKNFRWVRDDVVDRKVLNFGIQRTVPAGERKEFKRLASSKYVHLGSKASLSTVVQEQVARILGKDVTQFQKADISKTQSFYVGSDGDISYSEFHFGAGESSVIRMVAAIEEAPKNSLVLIEEIENGLHPVAARRMVEYLIDVASRRSIQALFTTHSEDALLPLPSEAIWYSINGQVRQGRISIEALRAISGRIEEKLAIFVEDDFAKDWVESIIRNNIPDVFDRIGVYAVSGESQAFLIHKSHGNNPAISSKLKSICVLDGDSSKNEDLEAGVIKLPGGDPETEVFNFVRDEIDNLSMQLAAGLHLSTEKDGQVKEAVKAVSLSNRDPHLLFNQVGQKTNLIPAKIVSSAFIGLWLTGNAEAAKRVSDFITSHATAAMQS